MEDMAAVARRVLQGQEAALEKTEKILAEYF